MTKIYVRESTNRAYRSAHRDAPAPQPRRDGNPERQPPAAQGEPSFLAKVKSQLAELVAGVLPDSPPEYVVAELWPLIGKQLAASYWNGVRDGASGKVKPKERQPSAAAGERAALPVRQAGMTYVVSGTWQPKAPHRGAHADPA